MSGAASAPLMAAFAPPAVAAPAAMPDAETEAHLADDQDADINARRSICRCSVCRRRIDLPQPGFGFPMRSVLGNSDAFSLTLVPDCCSCSEFTIFGMRCRPAACALADQRGSDEWWVAPPMKPIHARCFAATSRPRRRSDANSPLSARHRTEGELTWPGPGSVGHRVRQSGRDRAL
jgi:hypothetical protein